MKTVVQSFILLAVIVTTKPAFPQAEMSVFNATGRAGVVTTIARDYQALGINPANIAIKGPNEKKFTMGYGETGFSVYSNALTRAGIFDSLLKFKDQTSFTYEEKIKAARQFTDGGVGLNLDVMPAGYAINLPKFGGLAIQVKNRTYSYLKLDSNTANILFQGYNYSNLFTKVFNGTDTVGVPNIPTKVSDLIKDTRINFVSNVEISLGYANKILEKENLFRLYAGIGLKYVIGLIAGNFDATGGDFRGFVAIPEAWFSIDSSGGIKDAKFKPAGKGFGVDIGGTMIIKEKLRLGMSLVDMGTVLYRGTSFTVKDFSIDSLAFDGFDNYNVYGQLTEAVQEKALFELDPTAEVRVGLPAKLRMGASYTFGEKEIVDVGIDAVIPLNDQPVNLSNPVISLGGTLRLAKIIEFQSGATIGIDYNLSWPFGFVLNTPGYEIGVATRDISILFGQKTPNISLSWGFFRLKF